MTPDGFACHFDQSLAADGDNGFELDEHAYACRCLGDAPAARQIFKGIQTGKNTHARNKQGQFSGNVLRVLAFIAEPACLKHEQAFAHRSGEGVDNLNRIVVRHIPRNHRALHSSGKRG